MPDGVARLSGGIDEAGNLAVSQYVEGVILSVLESASSRFFNGCLRNALR
jgi:hypothetical protein